MNNSTYGIKYCSFLIGGLHEYCNFRIGLNVPHICYFPYCYHILCILMFIYFCIKLFFIIESYYI